MYEHRSTDFKPITTPVWDFEHTFSNYYTIVDSKPKKPSSPIKMPYTYWQSR